MRISFGEYERSDRSQSGPEARMFFLRLLLTSEPDVAVSLYSEPYEYYKPLYEAAQRAGWNYGFWWKLVSSDVDLDNFNKKQRALFVSLKQERERLRKALLKWAKRWNLRTNWYLGEALCALEAHRVSEYYKQKWASFEDDARTWLLDNDVLKKDLVSRRLDFFSESDDLDYYAMFLPEQFPDSEILRNYYPHLEPPYPLPMWLPALQYRKNYLKSVQILAVKMYDHAIEHLTPHVESITRQLPLLALAPPLLGEAQRNSFVTSILAVAERYCDEVEQYYGSLKGWRKSSRKPKLSSHMIWTARVRTHSNSPSETAKVFEEIAEEEGLELSAIKKAVKIMLDDLGLPLKPTFKSSKGRPRGSKNSPLSHRQLLSSAK